MVEQENSGLEMTTEMCAREKQASGTGSVDERPRVHSASPAGRRAISPHSLPPHTQEGPSWNSVPKSQESSVPGKAGCSEDDDLGIDLQGCRAKRRHQEKGKSCSLVNQGPTNLLFCR